MPCLVGILFKFNKAINLCPFLPSPLAPSTWLKGTASALSKTAPGAFSLTPPGPDEADSACCKYLAQAAAWKTAMVPVPPSALKILVNFS